MSFQCKYYTLEDVHHHGVKSANIPCNNCVNVGRRHRIDYRGPNLEVMSFRAEDSGSTGVSRSNVHLKESQDDGNTELHHGAPGQQSQAGDTVLGDLA